MPGSHDRLCCCTAGDPGIEVGGNLDAVQLQAALEMLQEELAGSHAEAAMLGKQASGPSCDCTALHVCAAYSPFGRSMFLFIKHLARGSKFLKHTAGSGACPGSQSTASVLRYADHA